MFQRPSALALERRLRFDPNTAGVNHTCPVASFPPRLSAAALGGRLFVPSRSPLAFHDGTMIFWPERCRCQMKFAGYATAHGAAKCGAYPPAASTAAIAVMLTM